MPPKRMLDEMETGTTTIDERHDVSGGVRLQNIKECLLGDEQGSEKVALEILRIYEQKITSNAWKTRDKAGKVIRLLGGLEDSLRGTGIPVPTVETIEKVLGCLEEVTLDEMETGAPAIDERNDVSGVRLQNIKECLGDEQGSEKVALKMLEAYEHASVDKSWKTNDNVSKVSLLRVVLRVFLGKRIQLPTDETIEKVLGCLEDGYGPDGSFVRARSQEYQIAETPYHGTFQQNRFIRRINNLFEWHTDLKAGEKVNIMGRYKAPYFAVIQSSGTGKTKLFHGYKQQMAADREAMSAKRKASTPETDALTPVIPMVILASLVEPPGQQASPVSPNDSYKRRRHT